MLLGYPLGEIALLALLIAGAGILVGIFAGLFGIGGGAIIVPVLYEVFRILHRHFFGDYRANDSALLSWAQS